MERLEEPMNSCYLSEHLNLDEGDFVNSENYIYEDLFPQLHFPHPKMPFLQMLGVESLAMPPATESNFHLLRLQQLKRPLNLDYSVEQELESCMSVTHMSEYPSSANYTATGHNAAEDLRAAKSVCSSMWISSTQKMKQQRSPVSNGEKKKRKRAKPCRNREEVENQRMNHITIERNRRKQMNDHLSLLRSLMPLSFVQRGDQASIVGGAIEFIKELEQLLQSLEVQKRRRQREAGGDDVRDFGRPFSGFFSSPQYTSFSTSLSSATGHGGEASPENMSPAAADVEVTVVQSHVNVKVFSPRRAGQLHRVLAAFEDLHLAILHLNVTSLDQCVLYSFSLKIEEDCKLGSADEIAGAVHQIFNLTSGN